MFGQKGLLVELGMRLGKACNVALVIFVKQVEFYPRPRAVRLGLGCMNTLTVTNDYFEG